jgi:hypothetical protein
MLRRAGLALLVSCAVVVPLLLIPSVQLGDLHTHLYNAWLARQLSQPWASDCFYLTPGWTNLLSDAILSALLPVFGPGVTSRIAAILAVSVFFWGVLWWQRTLLGRWPMAAAPILLALSYGWLLRAGFLNFLFGAGFAFAARASLHLPAPARFALPLFFVLLGIGAHIVACLLVFGLLACYELQSKLRSKLLWVLPLALAFALLAVRLLLLQSGLGTPSISVFGALGLTAFGGGGAAAALLPIALLLFCVVLLLSLRAPARALWATALLAAAAAFLIPNEISLPGSPRPMSYNTVRIASLAWVFLLSSLEAASPSRWVNVPLRIFAISFLLLFVQEQTWLSHLHDGVREAVLKLPAGSKVVLQSRQAGASVDGIVHMIDSACIGHCISLANYVPASGHFRIRRRDACPLSLPAGRIVDAENGKFIAQPGDLPLWRVYSNGGFAFGAASVSPGEALTLQPLTR